MCFMAWSSLWKRVIQLKVLPGTAISGGPVPVSQIGSGWVVGKLKWDFQLSAETEVMLKVSRADD